MRIARRPKVLLLFVVLLASGIIWSQKDAILDAERLDGYSAPSSIAALANRTTMTDRARHLFYVNHPALETRDAFNKHCTNKSEQSTVLGCYHGNRQGIYLFTVTDAELDGVEEVTAAHEMLHQAYDRLSSSERTRIDALLVHYYEHGLTDQSIKEQMAIYKKTEPNDLTNEMHSVFGTEVASLPSELAQYYSQYFTKRAAVTGLYAHYQNAFASRTQLIAQYDADLATQKKDIDAQETSLSTQLTVLNAQQSQLESYRQQPETYNSLVPRYNEGVNAYNAQLAQLRAKVSAYNDLIAKRNAIATSENALQQKLSSRSLVTSD